MTQSVFFNYQFVKYPTKKIEHNLTVKLNINYESASSVSEITALTCQIHAFNRKISLKIIESNSMP